MAVDRLALVATAPGGRAGLLGRLADLHAALKPSPRRMQVLMGAIFAAAGMLWLLVGQAFAELRATAWTVGRDTVPSIAAIERLSAQLAEMDGAAAEAFLREGPGAERVWARFAARIPYIADDLIQAAEDVTYGEEERRPLRQLAVDIQSYAGLVGEARALGGAAGRERLAQASALLHDRMIGAVAAIDDTNFRHLDQAMAAHGRAEAIDLIAIAAAFGLLGAFLVHTQLFLFRHAHRLLNPPLYLATLLLSCGAVWAVYAHVATHLELTRTRAESVDSMHALWRLRAAGFDAAGGQRRYLGASGDPAAQDRLAQHFARVASRLLDTDASLALARLRSGHPDLGGYLGVALDHAGLPGEPAAVTAMVEAWAEFILIDGRVRLLEQSGRHAEAVALALGDGDGQAGAAFARFDAATEESRLINRSAFDAAIRDSLRRLAPFRIATPALALLTAILAWLGLQPRIDEYRV